MKYLFTKYKLGFVFLGAIWFLPSRSIAQYLKVVDCDSIYTQISVCDTVDKYDYKKTYSFNPKCINISGDTIALAQYLYEEYSYPKFCIELGINPNKTYLVIEIGENGVIKEIKCPRTDSCKEETEALIELLKNIKNILIKQREILLVVSVKVIPHKLETIKSIEIETINK